MLSDDSITSFVQFLKSFFYDSLTRLGHERLNPENQLLALLQHYHPFNSLWCREGTRSCWLTRNRQCRIDWKFPWLHHCLLQAPCHASLWWIPQGSEPYHRYHRYGGNICPIPKFLQPHQLEIMRRHQSHQLLPDAPLAKHKWRNFSTASSTRPEAKARRLLFIKSVSWRDIAETGRWAISGGEQKKSFRQINYERSINCRSTCCVFLFVFFPPRQSGLENFIIYCFQLMLS